MRRRLRIFRLSAVGTVDPAGEEGEKIPVHRSGNSADGKVARWRGGTGSDSWALLATIAVVSCSG